MCLKSVAFTGMSGGSTLTSLHLASFRKYARVSLICSHVPQDERLELILGTSQYDFYPQLIDYSKDCSKIKIILVYECKV